MASEIASLRARVATLERENGTLASTLRKQVCPLSLSRARALSPTPSLLVVPPPLSFPPFFSPPLSPSLHFCPLSLAQSHTVCVGRTQESASRSMTESLQRELSRIQHLCNELSYTMVLQGIDPSVLSAVTGTHLRFVPAWRLPPPPPARARALGNSAAHDAVSLQVHQIRAGAVAASAPSTPRSAQQRESQQRESQQAATLSAASKSGSSALEVPFPLAASASYQLAPVPAPARAGQFRGVNATPPEAFIPDSLRKRLDASSALATRLGSPAMFGAADEHLNSQLAGVGGGERVFLTGAPTTLNAAFDAADRSTDLKPSPPPFGAGEHGADESGTLGYDGAAPTPPRGNSASGGRRTHSRGRRIVPSPMNPGLDPQPAGCS